MTLPNEKLLALLARDFVVGWKDIRKEDFCGVSRGYTKNQTAVGTTNGAGGRNVQVFVLTPNARVLLALPGFWHADDLRTELQFAKVLNRLWLDDSRTLQDKVKLWRKLQLRQPTTHSRAMRARSDWQGFDRITEIARGRMQSRDSIVTQNGKQRLLALDELVHKRLALRPCLHFDDFDIESFVDYGRREYDNNRGVDRYGKSFSEVVRREKKRQRGS